MLKQRNLFFLVVFAGLIAVAFLMPAWVYVAHSSIGSEDPWGEKEVLNYLFWTADVKLEQDVRNLQKEVGLSDSQMQQLQEIGLKEHQKISGIAKAKGSLSSEVFNDQAKAIFNEVDRDTRETLGPKYQAFRKWVRKWWVQEREYRENKISEKAVENGGMQVEGEVGPLAEGQRGYVYATQYTGDSSWQVALPDKYLKYANRGWWSSIPAAIRPRYKTSPYLPPHVVNIFNKSTGESVSGVPVREVGPWNEDDNYWDAANGYNPRRLFRNLPLGVPEASAAYFNNYNGGKDQFGRRVTNPAGMISLQKPLLKLANLSEKPPNFAGK